jgi:hypothetical protein
VTDIRANTPADTVSAAPIRPSATTTRLRRSEVFGAVDVEQARVDLRRIVAAPPPVPPIPPGPFGDLSRASIDEIAAITRAAWEQRSAESARKRSTATRLLLHDLAGFTGDTWQQRWAAAGLGAGIDGLRQFTAGMTANGAQQRRWGLRALFCLRVVRPSLIALFATPLIGYCDVFQVAQKDPLLDEFIDYVDDNAETDHDRLEARTDIPAALTAFGISMDALTPEALLHYAQEYRRTPRAGGARPHPHRYGASAAWRHLRRMGIFGDDVPDTVRHCTMIGRRSVPELVRRYPLRNKKVEQLLITYLEQRAVTLDYSSLVTLSHHLADLFWSNIEQINPEQADLRLHQATYARWKAMIALTKDGRPRRDVATVLMSVRGFYLDLQHWAHGEPERWAYWAVPCPIRQIDVRRRSLTETRRASERVAERTRQRQPLLGLLMSHVDERHQHATDLLAAALAVAPGEEFSHTGRRYQRTTTNYDRRLERVTGVSPARIRDLSTDEILNTADYEERTFWEWAVISTLRHSGVRVEELAELTHLSVRQYQRPNGEVVPLLVVAPSKTDRERVIPMSTELFATIAAIIRRHLRENDTIPAVKRFDPHEQLWGEPCHTSSNARSDPDARSCPQWRSRTSSATAAKTWPQSTRASPGSPSHRTTSGACSPPKSSTTVCRSTSAPPCSATSTSKPPAATSPSSTKTSSATTRPSSTAAAPNGPPTNTGLPPTRNGPSSSSTSTSARSNLATADAPTAPPATTNTPASAAPCSTSTRRCLPAWTSSRPTSRPGWNEPRPKAGWARPKASTSPCPSSATSAHVPADSPRAPTTSACPHGGRTEQMPVSWSNDETLLW